MGTKISEFSNGTLPLAGTELVPIVQGGSTVKTTASAFSTLAPVQSVAGRTGAVTLAISDVASLQTSLDGKLSTSGGVISANSSTDALRITQTGAGNALVVEDSTNPDSSPFVVTADGNVGVGTSTPVSVTGETSLTLDNATSGGRVDFYKAGVQCGVIRTAQTNLLDISAVGASTSLRLITNATERLRVDSSGNVGIGTSAPETKLHAVNTAAGAAVVGAFIQNADNTVGTETRLAFSANGASLAGNRYAWIGHVNTGGTNGGALTFATTIGGTPSTEKMRIDSVGNVGIGTAAPTGGFGRNLHIYNNLPSSDGAAANSTVTIESVNRNALLYIKAASDGNGGVQVFNASTGNQFGGMLVGNDGAVRFTTGASVVETMRITSAGNVGIGTSAPVALLEVARSQNSLSVCTVNNQDVGSSAETGLRLASFGAQWTFGHGSTAKNSNALTFTYSSGSSIEMMRISNNGNVCIGIATAPASAARTLCLGDSSAPTANPASGGVIYVEAGALKYRSAGGKTTILATNV